MALNRNVNCKVNQPIHSGVSYNPLTVPRHPSSAAISERITNGQFSSGSNWTIQVAGWTIATGVATNTTPNRRLSQLFVTGVIASGTEVNLSMDVTNPSGDEFAINLLQSNGTTVTEVIYDDVPPTGPAPLTVVNYTLTADAYGIQFIAPFGSVGGIILDNVSLIA